MSTIFIPKGRNTFYLSFFEDGKRKTRNIKIPKNKKKEALKFKKEFDSIMYLKNQSSPVYLESNVLNLDEGILKYINSSKVNWAIGRVNNVTTTLNQFQLRIGPKVKLSKIGSENISDFITYRRDHDKLSITSIRSDLQIIRSFFNFLIDEDIITKNPVNKKHIPKPEHKSALIFTEDELNKIFEDTKVNDTLFYLCLNFLSATGARPGDILNLKYRNIDLTKNILTINMSKTNRVILFPIYDSFREFIDLNYPNIDDSMKDELLFGEYKIYTIGRKFRKLKLNLNLNSEYNLKTFRKTTATNLIEKGIDGTTVAYLLGHTSVNTTAKYYINQKTDKIKSSLNSINYDFK